MQTWRKKSNNWKAEQEQRPQEGARDETDT